LPGQQRVPKTLPAAGRSAAGIVLPADRWTQWAIGAIRPRCQRMVVTRWPT
jgi:hypothetical protein